MARGSNGLSLPAEGKLVRLSVENAV